MSTRFSDLKDLKEPTETKGLSPALLHENKLDAQIPSMAEYKLRGRRVTFEPGATLVNHSHATRPGFVYIEKGSIIENRNGVSREFKAGDTWIEDTKTEHWIRNVSDKPAVLIVVDLPIIK